MSEHIGRLSKDRDWLGDAVVCGGGDMDSTQSSQFVPPAIFFSLAPGFSPVTRAHVNDKPLKRFSLPRTFHTGLKAGVNENEQS